MKVTGNPTFWDVASFIFQILMIIGLWILSVYDIIFMINNEPSFNTIFPTAVTVPLTLAFTYFYFKYVCVITIKRTKEKKLIMLVKAKSLKLMKDINLVCLAPKQIDDFDGHKSIALENALSNNNLVSSYGTSHHSILCNIDDENNTKEEIEAAKKFCGLL